MLLRRMARRALIHLDAASGQINVVRCPET